MSEIKKKEYIINIQCGDINEDGLITNLDLLGITNFSGICELLENSIDAESKNFIFDCSDKNVIKLIDDGKGLTIKKINDMFSLFKCNHNNDKSIGKAGVGAKPSTKKLSKNKLVILITKNEKGEYHKVIIPWDKIVKEGKYSKYITIVNCSKKEIKEFDNDRKKTGKTGATIILPNDDEIREIIKEQFYKNKDKNKFERFDMRFGNFDINIIYKDGSVEKKLKLYKYFDKSNSYYIDGKKIYNLELYRHKVNGKIIFVNDGKYCNRIRQPKPLKDKNYEPTGDIMNYTVGVLKDNKIFNQEKPLTDAEISGKDEIKYFKNQDFCNHTIEYFNINNKDVIRKQLSKCNLIRNNLLTAGISFPKFKISSARGGGESNFKTVNLQSKLEYSVFSTQDNILDNLMGIQSNKNQLNTKDIPIGLINMLQHLKEKAFIEIKAYIIEQCKGYKKKKINEQKESKTTETESEEDKLETSESKMIKSVIKNEIITDDEVYNSMTSEQNNDAQKSESESDESKVSIDAQNSELDESKVSIDAQNLKSDESKVSTDAQKSESESDESKVSIDAQDSELEESKVSIDAQNLKSDESKVSTDAQTLDDKEDLIERIKIEHIKLIDNKSANILSLKKLLQEYKNINSTKNHLSNA